MIDFNKPIPKIKVPTVKDWVSKGVDERLVPVSPSGIKVYSQYYGQGVAGSYRDCYVRETVLEMLVKVDDSLPKGYHLKVWDGYRPICIQQRLWNFYRREVKNKYPELSDEEIDFKTSFFISKPSYDITHPSLHNTGGAVDVTLANDDGVNYAMGTCFDSFTDEAWTNHFEEFGNDEFVRDNRRILYNAMTAVGFTNLPSEWWHYDFGDKFWAHFNNTDALYNGIIDLELPDRFPIT